MSDPEELDPEVDVDLSDDIDDDEDDVPDGFVVEGIDDADDADADEDDEETSEDGDDEDDEGSTRAPEPQAVDEDGDEFADDVAPVVRVPEEEDDAPARRSGEFVCTSCFLVKKESQLAVRSRKVCRDCA